MATKQGNYQYDFVDPLPEECPCPVCLEVQVNPHQVTCCGKIFCKSCLEELIGRGQNCPNCRKNLNNRYFPDLNAERRIKQLRVRCENHTEGCKWVGCIKDLIDKHIPECPNHLVPCTNFCEEPAPFPFSLLQVNPLECGVLVQRHDLHNHMTQLCKWRLVKCSRCKAEGNHYFITGEHIQVCPDVVVVCYNEGCEIKIKRKNLPDHQTSCPKQIVSCRYSSVGCEAKITRENIVSHNQECVEQHLDSAVDTIDQTSEDLEQTRKELEKTCIDLDETQGKLKQTNNRLNETQSKLKRTCNTLDQTRRKLDQTRNKIFQTCDKLDKVLKRIDSLEGKHLTQQKDSLENLYQGFHGKFYTHEENSPEDSPEDEMYSGHFYTHEENSPEDSPEDEMYSGQFYTREENSPEDELKLRWRHWK